MRARMIDPEELDTAVETYNRYRSSMATARVVSTDEDGFTVRFSGPFCRMCCDYDYFEDLLWELDELGIPATSVEIDTIDYLGDETFEVRFEPVGPIPTGD